MSFVICLAISITASKSHNLQVLLALMAHELLPQLLRIAVHKEIELGYGSEPNVARTYRECSVFTVTFDNSVHKSIAVRKMSWLTSDG
jgi:hypothetical protein